MSDAPVLSSFIQLSKDGEWGKSIPSSDSVEMLVIRGTDFDAVREGDWSTVPRRQISGRAAHAKALMDGDILIETAGGSRDRPTGRTIYVRPGTVAGQPLPVTCASFARFIRLDARRLDPGYAFWWLQDLYRRGVLRAFHTQHTGVARFQWTTCSRSLRIPAVDIVVQRKVSATLSAYDELIERVARRAHVLEEIARRAYQDWFTAFRYPGNDDTSAVESGQGVVPEGWRAGVLGDLFENVRQRANAGGETCDRPYAPIQCIASKSLALTESRPGCEAASSLITFRRGDVLFGAMRPYLHKVAIAPWDGTTRTTCFVLRAKNATTYSYAVLTAFDDATVAFATAHSSGTTIPYAKWDSALASKPVLLPDEATLMRFEDAVRPILEAVSGVGAQLENLRSARDVLLPRLIAGDVDVARLDPVLEEAVT